MSFKNRYFVLILVVILLSIWSCSKDNPTTGDDSGNDPGVTPQDTTTTDAYYTQGNNNRTAAEWEPAIGTMVVWPLGIPYKLAVELAIDNHLYIILKNESDKNQAQTWFGKWGVPSDKITYIIAPQGLDSWWTRDWGPSAVFTPTRQYLWGDGKYPYGTPQSGLSCSKKLEFEKGKDNGVKSTKTIDNATVPIANQLGYNVLDLPFINTGGNVATDGMHSAFSMCIILKENEYHGVTRENFMALNKSKLGFQNYHILSNFEDFGIQHLDCFMKLIDEETFLVAEPPKDHELYSVYENIVKNELSKLKTAYNRPYTIKRIKTAVYEFGALAAYTNSIILNKVVYVPLFDISQDAEALKTWQEAMPGYTIKGFKFPINEEPVNREQLAEHYIDYGWNSGDALHCRTRAVWDPEMLYITTKKIQSTVTPNDAKKVHATIIDYSGKGIETSSCKLLWRVKGQSEWNTITLTQEKNKNHFFGEIPYKISGSTVEYYITATSKSGKHETHPRTAPAGVHSFTIK